MSSIFADPIFITSFFAVIFICMATSLWGTILLIGRQPLLSESLSHACYPGLLFGVLIANQSSMQMFPIIVCGCLLAILGFVVIELLRTKLHTHRDSALCFVLVSFFGAGVVLSTYVKNSNPVLFNRIHAYLYGQAATLGYREAWLALGVLALSIFVIWWWYRQILVMIFDREFANTCGLNTRWAEYIVLVFIALVVVSGVRSIGVILLAAMFVAPPLAARQFSDQLNKILLLACLFGGIAGALGCYLSVALEYTMTLSEGRFTTIALPTGPLIVVIAGGGAIASLIFSFKTGWFFRSLRKRLFLWKRNQDDLLKIFWYLHEQGIEWASKSDIVVFHRFREYFGENIPYIMLFCLKRHKLLEKKNNVYRLTPKGFSEANRLIRSHRLWESYLVQKLDFSKDNVHPFAEEIEHILTEEMNQALSRMLDDPHCDPHKKIIPKNPGES